MLKKLSILIPVYNESAHIYRCLENVQLLRIPQWSKEIIVINDGSTDNTLSLLKKFQRKNKSIKIINSTKNAGKGHALKKGIIKASGTILIVQDADLEYDPSDYIPILAEFKNRNISVVYGSRILGAKKYHNYNANIFFYLGGILLTKIVNIFFKTQLTDQPTGYKSWRNSLSNDLLNCCSSNGFEFEIEMTSFFAKVSPIKEVAIHYYPRTVSHGKKINLKDFFKSVLMVFRCCWRR